MRRNDKFSTSKIKLEIQNIYAKKKLALGENIFFNCYIPLIGQEHEIEYSGCFSFQEN